MKVKSIEIDSFSVILRDKKGSFKLRPSMNYVIMFKKNL